MNMGQLWERRTCFIPNLAKPRRPAKSEAVCNITMGVAFALGKATAALASEAGLPLRDQALSDLLPPSPGSRVGNRWMSHRSAMGPRLLQCAGPCLLGTRQSCSERKPLTKALLPNSVPSFDGSIIYLLSDSVPTYSFSLCRSHGCHGYPESNIPDYQDGDTRT